MKKMIFVATALTALSLNTSALNLYTNSDFEKLGEVFNGEVDKNTWLNNKEETVEEKSMSIQRYVNNGKYDDIDKVENLMLDVLRLSSSNVGKWRERDSKIGSKVKANDELISLSRVLLGTVKFKEVKVVRTIQKDSLTETREVTNNYTSRTLMRAGRAPVGPDGAPLLLCRLFNVPDANFYELSSIQAVDFVNNSSSNMSFDEACITYKPLLSEYWKNRLPDFISDQGVELQ